MTPEERQLITGLFDRMRGFALNGKDGEADTLIRQQVGELPDAPYMLVQSVLVQEQALQQADARIKALEEEVRALQEAQQRPQVAQGGGSFLGGFFSSRAAPEPGRGASVPAVGARATPSTYAGPSAGGAPPAGGPQPAPQATGGGFLQSAMATAAGVAGGMLAASAISSLLSGSTNAGTTTATSASAPQAAPTATEPTASTPTATEASHASDSSGQGHHDASYDDGGWFGGDGGDFDL